MSAVNENLIRKASKLCKASQMFRRRMPSEYRLLRAHLQKFGTIDIESSDCSAPNRTQTDKLQSVPPKVKPPGISTRIKQANCPTRLRINYFLPRSLAQRTGDAGQRQIVQGGRTASYLWNYVVNMKCCVLTGFGNAAVFATVVRAQNHLAPQRKRYVHAMRRTPSSTVPNATANTKAHRSSPQSPPPLPFQPSSANAPRSVYQATREYVVEDLWEDETLPYQQANPIGLELIGTYAIYERNLAHDPSQRQLYIFPNKI